jgi:hypothetical protein
MSIVTGGVGSKPADIIHQSIVHLNHAHDASGVTAWALSPQTMLTPAGVVPVLGWLDRGTVAAAPPAPPAPPASAVSRLVTIKKGFSATVRVHHSFAYSANRPIGGHPHPAPFEAAPFLVEVQPMEFSPIEGIVPAGDPQLHLLPFTSYELAGLPAPSSAATPQFQAVGALQLGPFTAPDRPGYVRVSLVWYHEPGDWNASAGGLGGWSVPEHVAPFGTDPPLAPPQNVTFEVAMS